MQSKGLGTCGRKGPGGRASWRWSRNRQSEPSSSSQGGSNQGLKQPHGGWELFPAPWRRRRPSVNPAVAHEAVRPHIQPDTETQGSED